jgi:predicted Holliday junction resolvase-like endonuclease
MSAKYKVEYGCIEDHYEVRFEPCSSITEAVSFIFMNKMNAGSISHFDFLDITRGKTDIFLSKEESDKFTDYLNKLYDYKESADEHVKALEHIKKVTNDLSYATTELDKYRNEFLDSAIVRRTTHIDQLRQKVENAKKDVELKAEKVNKSRKNINWYFRYDPNSKLEEKLYSSVRVF